VALKPEAKKAVVTSVPNIYVGPPTTSPTTISPAVASWYTQWGQSNFDSVFNSFTLLGEAANAGDIDQISVACGGFVTDWQHGLLAPPIPDSGLDQRYRNDLTQLGQGGLQCVHGLQSGDADMATNGLNLMGAAGTALAQLQAEIAPGN
jgi:hypothetical protein